LIFSGIDDVFFSKDGALGRCSDDQKGLGSVLAISSDVTGNKAAPASAMQPVRSIPTSLSLLLNEMISHDTARSVKNIIFHCFMIGS
jgi:hypothetical protein